jgi:hypothetical protein
VTYRVLLFSWATGSRVGGDLVGFADLARVPVEGDQVLHAGAVWRVVRVILMEPSDVDGRIAASVQVESTGAEAPFFPPPAPRLVA